MISTELVEWLSRFQLLLPLELGQRLYHAKVRMIIRNLKLLLYEKHQKYCVATCK